MSRTCLQRRDAAGWYGRFGFSDFTALLHLPFVSVAMAFVIIGAALSTAFFVDRLLLAMLAVFFAMQGSHFLDETKGHHWGTKFSNKNLLTAGFCFLFVAATIGVYLSLTVSLLLFLFLAPMIFFPVAYNLELWNSKFHNPLWFSLSWGTLVLLGSFFLQSTQITLVAVLMSAAVGVQSAAIFTLYESTKK
jgi:hypothetical protein